MKNYHFLILVYSFMLGLKSQTLYFPPADGSSWDTLSIDRLGWCQSKIDSLYKFLEAKNSKGFILLKDGKIVLEKYFNDHSETKSWYWASAGKSLTSFMIGLAQQDGHLSIHDPTSMYLGKGWTSCTDLQESKITIKHQLSMTSGLDDDVNDPYCTQDSCLIFKADADSRWAYHNAPYTLLDSVLESATKMKLNSYVAQKLSKITGITGLFLPSGYNNIFYSTGRSMARFGLLNLNKGNWNGTSIMKDQNYFYSMTHSSQTLNPAYGYLWWLNSGDSFKVPGSQFSFKGRPALDAPTDMFSAMGKNGQFINVIPSVNMVWVRFGDAPDNSLVPFNLNNDIWKYINQLSCKSTAVTHQHVKKIEIRYISDQKIIIHSDEPIKSCFLMNQCGQILMNNSINFQLNEVNLPEISGIYFLMIQLKTGEIQKIKVFVP